MRTNTLLSSVIISAALCACSATADKTETATDTSLATDTVAVAPIEEPAPVLVTPDLTYAEVTGNVKSVKMDGTTLEFDADGNLTSGLPRLKRDKEGRISQWGYDEYFVTWENDRPKTLKARESDGGTMTSTYVYDADGRLVKETIRYDFPGEEPATATRTYTYADDSFDSHGNWTRRTVKDHEQGTYTQTRTLLYH